jgi:hypothetical protein
MDQNIITGKQNFLHARNDASMFSIAYSSLCCKYIDEVLSIGEKNPTKSIEWDLNFIPPTINTQRILSIINTIKTRKLNIRYHLPYSFIELCHKDNDLREFSFNVCKRYINFISELGGTYAVIHIGYDNNCDDNVGLAKLSILANYAFNKGVLLCVENLIDGLTTNTDFLKKCVSIPNVYLCLDIGHAMIVQKRISNFFSNYSELSDKILHSHVYYTEDSNYNHIAFDKNTLCDNLFLSLAISSRCKWMTMELDSFDSQTSQSELIMSYWGGSI